MRITHQFQNVHIYAIHMEYYFCLCLSLLKTFSGGGERTQTDFFFYLVKAKINYSSIHASIFLFCFIKIAYAVVLSILLMTMWWLLD